ncbi:hypothetical protein IC615_21730 [Serratia ureilytica]
MYDIPETPILAPSVPYGRAMAHQRFYVLDRHLRVLPPCLPGSSTSVGPAWRAAITAIRR